MDEHVTGAARPRPDSSSETAGNRNPWALLLLLVPFVALLYPPFYTTVSPTLIGVPFFIWYQFLWVILGSLVTIVVYQLRRG